MENESQNVSQSGSENGDFDYGGLDAAGAKVEIDKIYADANHPYYGKDIRSEFDLQQHKKATQHMSKLFQVKAGEFNPLEQSAEVPAKGETTEQLSGDALQSRLRAELEQINSLWEGDIDVDDVLQDATPEKLSGYIQMRLLAEGNYKTLTPILVREVSSLGMPSHQVSQLQAFLQSAVPGDPLSDDLTNIIIRHIHRAKTRNK